MATFAHPESLVDLAWVDAQGRNPKARLVEVDVDPATYESGGHIPGAVAFDWQTQLQDPVRREIVAPEAFAELLGESGIANDTLVVLYGDHNNWFAAYAFWLLRYYGHRRAALLDGGRDKWIAEGRPIERVRPAVPRAAYKTRMPDPSIRAYRDQLLALVQRDCCKVPLVDVRSEAEYLGEIVAPPGLSETAQRAGHIPGAVNVPWARTLNDDGTFRPAEELRALYEPLGVVAEKPIITYCRIGERSAHTWFVLSQLLGYPNVRNYDGSWTEWGSMVGVPVQRGAPGTVRDEAAA